MGILKSLVPAAVAAVLVLGFALLGGTIRLGAHPFWSVQVAYIGLGVGAVLLIAAYFLGLEKAKQIILFAVVLVIAAAVTKYGKTAFAASYAEDTFAGKLWYFGWMASCAMAFGFLATLFSTAGKK